MKKRTTHITPNNPWQHWEKIAEGIIWIALPIAATTALLGFLGLMMFTIGTLTLAVTP